MSFDPNHYPHYLLDQLDDVLDDLYKDRMNEPITYGGLKHLIVTTMHKIVQPDVYDHIVETNKKKIQ